jgi:GAF domain-containing protein/DNA-binding NarL/FixJ family response regulator
MSAVGLRGNPTVLFVDADASAAAEGALAVERSENDAATAIEADPDAALERLAAGDADCLVVTDGVDDDPAAFVARVRDRFRGPVVFVARDGGEELASEAVAAGADEYVPIGEGWRSGSDRLAERVGAALDRVREERDAPPYRALFEDGPAGVALLRDGVVAASNDRFGRIFGREDGEEPEEGEELADLVPDADRERVRELLASVADSGEAERVTVGERGGPGPEAAIHAVPVEGEGVGVVAHDVSGRRGRERRLAALHRTTREMVRSGRADDIAAVAVETAIETLDPLAASAYVYDRDQGELRRAAAASGVVTRSGAPATASLPDAGGTDGFAWDAFVAGELQRGADPPEAPSRIAIPLGDHGVLVVTGETAGAFDEPDVAFARTLATNAEVALSAAHRDSALERRTERLRERTATLEKLRRIDDVVRDIGQLLVGATDRREIERAVCDRLAAVEGWSLAWIGERSVAGEGLTVRTHSGEGAFFEALATASEVPFEDAPASSALAGGSWRCVEDLVAHPAGEAWREFALEYGHQSVVSIPLVREGREYGVLEVYGHGTDAFGEAEREVLVELGEMTAYAIHAVERERALLADSGPEIVVESAEVDSVFEDVAAEVGGEVTVDGVVPQSNGDHLVYLGVESAGGDPSAAVGAVAGRSRTVREYRRVGEGPRFEVRLSSAPFVDRVAANGGRIREVTATGEGCVARIELPNPVDVREFVEALGAAYPDLVVTAQRSAGGGESTPRRAPVERLTDRQREVLAVAVHSGFFEWPRDSTGEEVADALGIAPPTYHKHVRTAERKLLTGILPGPDPE